MAADPARSIVPMFGGGTQYVETLDMILEYVEEHTPTTEELVGWHRGHFHNVSSRDSIMRRVAYLRNVGFLEEADGLWHLGDGGREYYDAGDLETLSRIMCDRNIGLRSLLYSLSVGSMSLQEMSQQQLETHPELDWDPASPDMAKQRVNWLRSMGLVEKGEDRFSLTGSGEEFVHDAIDNWANPDWSVDDTGTMTVETYETVAKGRVLDPEFRETVLVRHDRVCPVSGVDKAGLLDVAHVLSWSEYPDHRATLTNVLPLDKTHHAAFDREFFTLDHRYRLRVSPDLETASELLQDTLLDQAGERMPLPDGSVDPDFLEVHNQQIDWFSA